MILVSVIVSWFSIFADDVVPLLRAHSHNDYMRTHPLEDALSVGFCSVEADIYFVENELLVCHDLKNCKREINLKEVYIIPIFTRVAKNNGYVYSNPSEFFLLIDIKNEPEKCYSLLKEYLIPYERYLTRVVNGNIIKGGVTIILSGSVPRKIIANEENRLVFIDGRLEDLETNPPNILVPWISSSWFSTFSWLGIGEIPPDELSKLREIVKKAHEQGRKLRFWSAPQTKEAWEVLYSEGVDLINTDFPSRLAEFLRNKTK